MVKTIVGFLSLLMFAGNGVVDPDWLKLPQGRIEIGSMHGTVAVSSANEIYINVEGTVRQRFAVLGPNPGLQVYSADGKYLRNVPNARPSICMDSSSGKNPTANSFMRRGWRQG